MDKILFALALIIIIPAGVITTHALMLLTN